MRIAWVVALVLSLATPAAAQLFSPRRDNIDTSVMRAPQAQVLRQEAYRQVDEAHTRPRVVSLAPMKTADCRMTGAGLIIRHDGTGEVDATTLTTAAHADRTWRMKIAILDGNDRPLFDTGNFDGPEMNDGQPSKPYAWVRRFTMDPATLRKVLDGMDHTAVSYAC